MNSTNVVVEINFQLDRICSLTGNTGLRKLSPLRYTLVDLRLTGTHFIMVLLVIECSQDTHILRQMRIHPSHQGRHITIQRMDHIQRLGKFQDPYHIVRAIDGSLLWVVPRTYPLDHPCHQEGAVVGTIIVSNGEVGMEVADALAMGAVGLITDSNLAFNRR